MAYILEGKTGKWEVVIGLEVHCQLKTKSKLFSRSSAEFGAEQNKCVSYVDCAMPGQLPILNEYSVIQAIKTGLGLNAEFNLRSVFDRKSYFYADLPQGYQITQFFVPIIKGGWLEISLEDGARKKIRIHEAHLEQDAGKSIHDQHPVYTMVDLNRAGATLLEIVSEPDMRSPYEAMTYLRDLRTLVRVLDTCDGNMDEGSMRCDANVSVMKLGAKEYGTRCEVKNVNSIKNVGDAIEYEAKRQVEILENGGVVEQETRKFNALTGTTKTMRSKEDAIDYRYFPDPDLAPLIITRELIDKIGDTMPELPEVKKNRYVSELGLTEYDASVLALNREISEYFEKLIKKHNPKLSANWLTSELFGRLNKLALNLEQSPVSAEMLSELLDLIEDGTISGKIAKEVLDLMFESGKTATMVVEENNLRQTTNIAEVEKIIDDVIRDNQKQVEQYRGGNERIFGFFVGQVMKLSGGKVNPQLANELLKTKLQ
ncbi:MAG: Asp-tRNA(Asn)/Glu-tRNA(Gln) amidotransferase subunit GatB [Rickettsiales bacterium]|jgi:aspartyl-tRNA(Asn)/glutamyl-tRNA(Gln) amidotransferase subunit B|nr:Asp-tRNA(Asn)/Glu-tRNA(Gln) amidotransferase subunit GatB [Rickettsiales bacterium]